MNADVFFFPSQEETEGIVVLEALAGKREVLVRDIPVYHPWLSHRQNCYMGKTNEEFTKLLRSILKKELPSVKEAGYLVAKSKSIAQIGTELERVYGKVLRG